MQRLWALVCVVAAVWGWLHFFRQRWILDKPWPDVPKRPRVPTFQGVIMLILILLLAVIFLPHHLSLAIWSPFAGMLRWLLLIVGINIIDEMGRNVNKKYRVPARIRLIVQTTAGVLAFSLSGVGIHSFILPGGREVPLSPLTQLVFTVAWFRLFCNAINWFDGIYGLATGMSTIGFWSIALLVQFVVLASYVAISPEKASLLQDVVVVSAICAFVWLIYTIVEYKPRWLVRDVGTMSCGFILAYLALLGGAKIGTMLVVLALPLFDAIWVILDRLRRRRSPLKGDFTHLHYRLLALGWNRHEARATIRGWSIGITIIMLLQGTQRMDKIIIFVLMAIFFFGLNMYLFWVKKLPSEYDRRKHIGEPEGEIL